MYMLDAIKNKIIKEEELTNCVARGHDVLLVDLNTHPPPYQLAVIDGVGYMTNAYSSHAKNEAIYFRRGTRYDRLDRSTEKFDAFHDFHKKYVLVKSYYAIHCDNYIYFYVNKFSATYAKHLPPAGIEYESCDDALRKYERFDNDHQRVEIPNDATNVRNCQKNDRTFKQSDKDGRYI